MINDVKECWICKEFIGKSGEEHHLFNFYDYSDKMMRTFPGKYNDKNSIRKLRLGFKKIKDKIPSYKVHKSCHKKLEMRLAKLRVKEGRHNVKWIREILE